MSLSVATLEAPPQLHTTNPVADAARGGLVTAPKSLPPWLFYDAPGSRLFEQITTLREYYLTRTERALFAAHATEIFRLVSPPDKAAPITIAELGAGTAEKTGILLRALTRQQQQVLYQPIDISPTALDQARTHLERSISNLTVRPQVANYITESVAIERPPDSRILALYIGSSVGNFTPEEACQILTRLRSELVPGDFLLLGADLAPTPPGTTPAKSVATLLAAYNDAQGVTAAFNRNILSHLNRQLGSDFRPDRFLHRAVWNASHSRIEIYLESICAQTVHIPANAAGAALTLQFAPGEQIHTENSYKFTPASIASLLTSAGFAVTRSFTDPTNLFAVTLAAAV